MVSVKAVRYSNVFLTNLLCAKTSFFRLPLRIVFKTVIQSLNCMKIAESLINVFEAKLEYSHGVSKKLAHLELQKFRT